jgi:hypothetical protein
VADFTSLEDLEAAVGAQRIAQLFDEDGDGVADDDLVERFVDQADQWVRMFLESKGMSRAQLDLPLVQANPALRSAATSIALGFRGESKAEWLNADGEGPYEKLRRDAKEMLGMLVKGQLRLIDAGAKSNLTGRLTAPDPTFIIAPSGSNPKGAGGF